ncbi:glycosyltransferase family 2 protein [Akkermansiaceae bacterium]|nr:glycosyltransferase family 2 protein [Akkermansiaceae bacterium]
MAKVSIIITSYNYEKYVLQAIESCLHQNDYDDYEVIVVDDGSQDSTFNILKSIKDSRFKYFVIENSGIECCSNYGILKSEGEYILRVDADDVLHPNYLSNMVPLLENNKGYAFVYSNYYNIDGEGMVVSSSSLPQFDANELRGRGDFLATGTIYRKSVIKKYGYYSEKVKNCGLENFKLILQLLSDSYAGHLHESYLFYYRRHSQNISEVKRKSIIEYGNLLCLEMGLGAFKTNQYHPYLLVI